MAIAISALFLASCGTSGSSGATSTTVPAKTKVGIFLIESAGIITQLQNGFEQGFLQESHLKANQVIWDVKNADGNATLIESIAQYYAQGKDKVVAVIGTPAVIALAKIDDTTPIIAVAMGDPVGSGVAKSLTHPDTNVSGSIDYVNPSLVLSAIITVKPGFHTIGTIYNPSNENSQVWVKALQSAVSTYPGLKLVSATITSSAQDAVAAQSLQGRAQAVLIGPDADAIAGLPAIAQAAIQAKQQLYLTSGDATTPGVLATLGPNYPELGVQAGIVAGKVALGAKVGQIPFATPGKLIWSVNNQVASSLGVTLPAEATAS